MNKWQKIYCDTYYNGKYPRSKEGKNAMKLLEQIKDKVLVDKPDFRGLHGFNPAHVEILTVTGGAIKGKKIDMAVASHKEAMARGVYYADVYLKLQ